MIIKLVRHAESLANVGAVKAQEVGDHTIGLTERGIGQARACGAELGAPWLRRALTYCSPYERTRQTLDEICRGAGLPDGRQTPGMTLWEDPRLREVEHGYEDYETQQPKRALHGWFYYRYDGGESPADCFDRISTFLETLMRQVARRRATQALLVTHGMAIRCFVMRFLHLSVEQFEDIANPDNCDVVTLAHASSLDEEPLFRMGRWGVVGLRLRDDAEAHQH